MKNNNFKITISRLAEICNVSAGTVDRALNNRNGISAETKNRILKVAEEYGFRPDSFAQKKDKIIGVILFDLFNEYFSELIMYIENICKEYNCSITIMFSDKNKETERKCVENLYYMGVDGIIICPVNKGNDYAKFLKSFKIPIITLGNKLDGIPFSGIDYFKAMSDATDYVASKNYSEILYYTSPCFDSEINVYSLEERYKGFISAVKKHNVNHTVCDNMQAAIEFINSHKNIAVMCTSDYYALKIMSSIEGDISIMGFDNIHILDSCRIRLDSVACDTNEIAKSAVEFILFNKPSDNYKNHKIIKRNSI